jgi:hypothetical protein
MVCAHQARLPLISLSRTVPHSSDCCRLCVCGCQFDDEWTPEHLRAGETNMYKEIAVALKGAEWRQPGLVALAKKLATSTGPREPIKVEVPASYEPKAGVNLWAARGGGEGVPQPAAPTEPDAVAEGAAAQPAADGAACTGLQAVQSQALPEPGASQVSEARETEGAAAAFRAPPPRATPPHRPTDEVELGSGSMLGQARGESMCEERSVVFAPHGQDRGRHRRRRQSTPRTTQ